MKKKLISIIAIPLVCLLLASCSTGRTNLSGEAESLFETVMNSKSKWETYSGKYCIYIQLRQVSGSYILTCGYADEPLKKTDDAVSSFAPDISVSYDLTESSVGEGYVDKMMSAYDSLYGPESVKLIGNTAYYYNDTDAQKRDTMESLFGKISEQQ